MTYGSRCRFATSDVTDGLVEEYRGAPRPVWVQREIRYFANARPAERDIQPLGGGAFARVEQEEREALLGGVALELFHECAGDAASTRAPMDHELGDVGAVWLVRCPRRLQLDSADNPVAISRDQDHRARRRARERLPPPSGSFLAAQVRHEADASTTLDGVHEHSREPIHDGVGCSRDAFDADRAACLLLWSGSLSISRSEEHTSE